MTIQFRKGVTTIFLGLFLSMPIISFFIREVEVLKGYFILLTGIFAFTRLFTEPKIRFDLEFYLVAITISVILFFRKNDFEALSFILLQAFWLMLYLFKTNFIINSKTILTVTTFIFIVEIFLFASYRLFYNIDFYVNQSLLSILLAYQFAFILPWIFQSINSLKLNRTFITTIKVLIIAILYIVLYKTRGRSGIVGLSCTLAFWNFLKLKSNFKFKAFAIVLIIAVFFGLFYFKENSSNGRLMIYNITVNEAQLSDWVTGIGYGNFKVQYNQWQASYFAKHNEYSDYTKYAENTYYFFNDLFQLMIETGIIGLVIFSFIVYVLVRRFNQMKIDMINNPFLAGSWLSLICLVITSLFFYPFQTVVAYPLLIISLATILQNNILTITFIKVRSIFNQVILFFISMIFVTTAVQIFSFEKRLQKCEDLSRLGLKSSSLKHFEKMSHQTVWNPRYWLLYSDVLYKTNQIDKALKMLQKSAKHTYNDKTALLFGNIYHNTGDFKKAESYFLEAVHIVPKSYRNRFALLQYYRQTKQTDAARCCAEFILSMPYEHNQRININIRNYALNFLNSGYQSD